MDGNDVFYSVHCHGFIMVEQRQIGEDPLNGKLNEHHLDKINGRNAEGEKAKNEYTS